MGTIANLITPDVWNGYGIQRTAELNNFVRSGIAGPVPGVTLPDGGYTLNMPFFGQLTGDAENLSVGGALTLARLSAGQQTAVVLTRGRGWTVSDLEGQFSGADPVHAAMDMISLYWAGQDQKDMTATLGGVFAAASMAANVHDISELAGALAVIGGGAFIDALYKLGDAADQISAIVMHSATRAKLAKDDLIAFVQPSGAGDPLIETYMGKRLVVDDSMPVAGGVYTSYLFAPNALAYVQRGLAGRALETDRNSVTKEDVLTMARTLVIHPVGMKWVGAAQPSRAQLAVGTSWERSFDAKNVPLIAFKHKLA